MIGNPPYKEKAKGKGSWIEQGSGNRRAPLSDWQPPVPWGVGAHAKHLRNLYVYFWRWAAWKVFEQGAGGRDREPPVAEHLSGLVCYITVAGFLNGPGFEKMRHDLRRDCDEIWVIDCSPEGHQPEVATRIFQDVQHPVCIVLASRSPANDPAIPARVRYRALAPGRRETKFMELADIALDSPSWIGGASGWRAPFLPEFTGGWGDLLPLEALIGDSGSGVMPGRTWVIAPDAESLRRRWDTLIRETTDARRAALFHPHEGGDKTVSKPTKVGIAGHRIERQSIDGLLEEAKQPAQAQLANYALRIVEPTRYGFRSFDRQWIIPDNRLINRPNPGLWASHGPEQVYLTALSRSSPDNGPSVTLTASVPDHDHFKGSAAGRVFALWQDAANTRSNVAPDVLAALSRLYGALVNPVDLFAYVTALLAHPGYVERFREDLTRPGLRVPLTADAGLFAEAATLGREVIWLHSFGERMAEGRPAGPPRLPAGERPVIGKGGAIPATPDGFPNNLDYNSATRQLRVGAGVIDNVPPEVWTYEVSGRQVLRQWFSYRRKDRSRPQIGDRRPPSPLGDIQPDQWLPEYTTELINVLNVLGLLVRLEPRQADLLARICDSPLVPASRFAKDDA